MWVYNYSDSQLEHHGALGMKWGVRRYQNADGSLTAAGKKRYSEESPDAVRKKIQKAVNKARGEKHGASNRWMSGMSIGEYSDKVAQKKAQAYDEWTKSVAYKKSRKRHEKTG